MSELQIPVFEFFCCTCSTGAIFNQWSLLFSYFSISVSLLFICCKTNHQNMRLSNYRALLFQLPFSRSCLCHSLGSQDIFTLTYKKKTIIIFHTLNSTAVRNSIFPFVSLGGFFSFHLLQRSLYFSHMALSSLYIFPIRPSLCFHK